MSNSTETNTSLVEIISAAIKVPGVKVDRENFLLSIFKNETIEKRNEILEIGPVKAGCSKKILRNIACRIVNERTIFSSTSSFLAGLPGGWVMAATIPADTLQFFGVALRAAQEISYLYGAKDLWNDGEVSTEEVQNQLILYCGVMFGVSGASSALRVVSSAMGKQLLKKLPQKALTKTFYYPIIKAICKILGIKLTKDTFAKGVSKVVPIFGGIVSGAITFFSMRPMGMRLVDSFEKVGFSYSKADFEADWKDISEEFGIDKN